VYFGETAINLSLLQSNKQDMAVLSGL